MISLKIASIIDIYDSNQFEDRFNGINRDAAEHSFINMINISTIEKDEKLLSIALDIGFHFELFDLVSKTADKELIKNLCDDIDQLMDQFWHTEHENLVEILCTLRAIWAVEPLKKAVFAKPPYLVEVDDADSLSRKAIWALGKLVLPIRNQSTDDEVKCAASIVLYELAGEKNTSISTRARNQIERIENTNTVT